MQKKEFQNTLRSCPFCGGRAEKEWGISSIFWIKCTGCGVEGSQYGSLEEAIKAWNTRKPMDKIVEQLEKISPEPKAECYALENEYTAALEMHYKCVEIVKDGAE